MKRIILVFSCLFSCSVLFGQKTFIDTIAASACKCFEAKKSTVKSSADFNKLGEDCFGEAATPYLEQIAKEEGINVEDFTEDTGNKFGRKVGVKLAAMCPAFVEMVNNFPDEDEKNDATGKITGIVTAVQVTDHVYITVKEPSGTLTKLAWVFYFPGADEYKANPAKLKGKKVEVEWMEEEVYMIAKKDFVLVKAVSGLGVK